MKTKSMKCIVIISVVTMFGLMSYLSFGINLFPNDNVEVLMERGATNEEITGNCGGEFGPCQITCPVCGAIYVVDGRNAPATNVTGSCPTCNNYNWK